MSAAAAPAPPPRRLFPMELGRPFIHPAFDVLVIGGGLSLAVTLALKLGGGGALSGFLESNLWTLVLLSNSAHFAASTARLYAKPGARRSLPFLAMGLPLASVAVLFLALAAPQLVGRHLMALYLTWSPYHYAAQAYGLAVMYGYRSGFEPDLAHKGWIRLACLLPFAYAFVSGRGVGLEWLLPETLLDAPGVDRARAATVQLLGALSFLAPVAVFARGQAGPRPMPLISLVVMIANTAWWVTLTYLDAFVWATIFHGLQYLAIVTIFQVKDDLRQDGGAAPWWRHAARFYLTSLGLGFLLFQAWPHAFALAGWSYAQSLLMVVATINIHHFVVDAFIWRLRRDPNYDLVKAGVLASA